MKCCGINNSKDWGDLLPSSCCPIDKDKKDTDKECTEKNVFDKVRAIYLQFF